MKPLSPTDSMFLWIETRSQPMHVAGLNLYTPPAGAGPDYLRRLVEGWRQHLQAVSPFNQRPVLKLGRWYWEEDTDFELDYHLRHVALPQPGRIRELLALVSRVHVNLLDRNRPLWEAYVIEGLPGVRSGLWELVRSSQADSGSTTPYEAPPTPFNTEITGSRRFAAQSYSLERLRQIGKATGATVNDVTLAICAGALRRHLLSQNALPKTPLTAMVPVSLHGDPSAGDEGGNQVALLLANLATHIADPMRRLKRIVASTTAAKQQLSKMSRLQKIAHGAAMLAPAGVSLLTGHARKRPAFNLVISNVPGPRETLYLDGARLDEVYPVSIPSHYLALNITISGYGDRLGFGYIACRRAVPALQRMLDYTDEGIAELEQAVSHASQPAPATRARRSTVAADASGVPRKRSPRTASALVAAKTRRSTDAA